MPRLYHKNEWFDEISPSALSEIEFENLLIQNADIIQTDTVIIPFKKTVYSPHGSARADLAMISTDYSRWTVIEVEMSRHDLYSHVIPQVRNLREANYTQEYVAYIHEKCSDLDAGKLASMMLGGQPDILVIVNKPSEEWRKELRRYDIHMMVFEIFRSRLNKNIFIIDGELPKGAYDVLSELSFGILPRHLKLSSPATLPIDPGKVFPVLVEGQITYWERYHTATDAYLTPVGNLPICPNKKYALIREENGEYAIRPLTKKG